MPVLFAIGVAVTLYVLFWIHVKFSSGVCRSKRDLKGHTVIVTGANTGIGLETARNLATRNARVILACRLMTRAERAAREIAKSTGNYNIEAKQVDLSSMQSVRDFAKDILRTERRLHVLINNAGVMAPDGPQRTYEGLEVTMATNHFGPFLLTNLLLPLLKRSAPSRIVMVSSITHEWARIDFDNLNGEKPLGIFNIYGVSKLANVLFARELAERLKDTGVTVNALHPGAVRTELARGMKPPLSLIFKLLFLPFMKSAKQGAQTSTYVAVAEELQGVSGKYFSDCKEKPLKKHALDKYVAKKLWEISEKITELE